MPTGYPGLFFTSQSIILGAGLTSAPPFVPLPCDQGIANETIFLPPGLPAGFQFRAQSLGISSSGAWAFSPAIECTVV